MTALPYPYLVQSDGSLDAVGVQGNFDALTGTDGSFPIDRGVFTATFAAGFQATPVTVTHRLPVAPVVVVYSPWGALLSNGVGFSATTTNPTSSTFDATAVASASLTGTQMFAWVAYG